MNKQQFLVPVELNANLIVKEFKKKNIFPQSFLPSCSFLVTHLITASVLTLIFKAVFKPDWLFKAQSEELKWTFSSFFAHFEIVQFRHVGEAQMHAKNWKRAYLRKMFGAKEKGYRSKKVKEFYGVALTSHSLWPL